MVYCVLGEKNYDYTVIWISCSDTYCMPLCLSPAIMPIACHYAYRVSLCLSRAVISNECERSLKLQIERSLTFVRDDE